ncbi:MAG: T9SS type A sorting domain-containing protein [Ignavibacteriae bacterium]|nr:T9SS type A sorting domain-containing protein [Ignavibacteriota bacterium]
MNAKVLEYNVEGDSNCVVNNFLLEQPYGFYYSCDYEHSFIRDTIETVFNEQKKIKFYESRLAVTCLCPYTISKYAQDIGKVYYDVVSPSMTEEDKHITGTLVYGKINDKIYGDSTLVGVKKDVKSLPTEFSLSQNYPNPFNPTTTIRYSIPVVGEKYSFITNVKLKVYDILGKEVATLINKQQKSGNHEVIFDATNLSSGVYYYQLKSGKFIETKKMIILK